MYADFIAPAAQQRIKTNILNVYKTCTSSGTEFMETLIQIQTSKCREAYEDEEMRGQTMGNKKEAYEESYVIKLKKIH